MEKRGCEQGDDNLGNRWWMELNSIAFIGILRYDRKAIHWRRSLVSDVAGKGVIYMCSDEIKESLLGVRKSKAWNIEASMLLIR